MKKWTCLVLSFILLFISSSVYGIQYSYDGAQHEYNLSPITLQINGETVQTEMPPIIFQNYSLVPARAVFEKLGAIVEWNGNAQQVKISINNTQIVLTINSRNAMVNGKLLEMQIPPKIINEKTMIPVRFVAEAIGMKVDWKDAERIIKIDRPDVNVSSIQYSLMGSTLRITINSDSEIKDYATLTYENPPRIAVDIKNALLTAPVKDQIVKSNYVQKIRSAQNNVNPNITRVVADLSQWTDYNVSLSQDKKQIYIDVSNEPTSITAINFTSNGGMDALDIDMKNVRETTLNPVVFSDNVTIDIPMAKLADLNKTINAAGTFVKSFEYVQYDPTTVRVTITTKGQNLIELKKKEGGIRLELTSAFAKGINYSIVNGLPQFSLNNERIGFNYFNYKYSAVGKKYSITVPASLIGLGTGRFSVNDEYLKNIDIIKNSITNLTEVQFNGKKDVSYITDTVSNSEKLTVGIRESSIVGTINQKIKDKIVVIDPGHGGDENGAIFPDESGNNNIQVKEKDLNLDISLKLYGLLKSAGIKTFITRTTDSNVSLNERADFANNLNADLFLSVHNNAGNSWENGSMALYYPSVYSSRYGISSERFAQITEEEMLKGLGTNNLGVWKRPRLAVLNGTKMPSVLAEVAYVSNEGNRQSLKMDSFRQKAAQSLYNSVIKALNESVDYSIKTPIQTGVQPVDTPKPEDFLSRNINGFSLPPKAYSKCEYAGNNVSQPSIFDLRIKLDYSKEISKKATLEVQRKEVSQILLSKLSQDTVNKIMEAAAYQKDFDSYIWDDEIEGNGYAIWVRCLKGTGVTTIDLIRK